MRSFVGTLLVTITCIVSVYSLSCIHCENSTGIMCPEHSETKDCPNSEYKCGTSYLAELRGNQENIWIVKGCKHQQECKTSPAVIRNPDVTVVFGVECDTSEQFTLPEKVFTPSKTENKYTCSSCFSESLEPCQKTNQINCYGDKTRCGRIVIDFGGSKKKHLSMRGCANPEFCSNKAVAQNFTSLIKEKDCYVQCNHCENSTGLTCLEKSETIKDCPDSDHQCATSYFAEKRGGKTVSSWSVKGCKKTNECTKSPATVSNPDVTVTFGVACCANNSCAIPADLFRTKKIANNQTCTSCYSNSFTQCETKEKIKCSGDETECGRIKILSAGDVDTHWSMRGCATQEFCSSELVVPGAKFNFIFTSEKDCTNSGSTHILSVLILTVAVFWTLLF
ncbi:uncharacterized protein LOC120916413 [Rana temporaria]|uniref:uncharacterized protein LOC120916413 n=1 Tax=Rana temporaria TaxID=8407 RepID=UPI001AAD5979|nr:uncharacterized protein LOC120916413 [Rana temporaria]